MTNNIEQIEELLNKLISSASEESMMICYDRTFEAKSAYKILKNTRNEIIDKFQSLIAENAALRAEGDEDESQLEESV